MPLTRRHAHYRDQFQAATTEACKADVLFAYTMDIFQKEQEHDQRYTRAQAFDFAVTMIDKFEHGGRPIADATALIDQALIDPIQPFDRVVRTTYQALGL